MLCHVTRCAPYAILHPSGVTSGHSISPCELPHPLSFFFFFFESHCFWITGYFYYFLASFLCTFFFFLFRRWTATFVNQGIRRSLRRISFWAQYNLRLFQNPPIVLQWHNETDVGFFELIGAINKNNKLNINKIGYINKNNILPTVSVPYFSESKIPAH